MHFLLSLFLTAHAFAAAPAPLPTPAEFTEAELAQQKLAYTKVNQAFAEAEANLPPCAGLAFTSGEALRTEPARDCPRAREFQSHIIHVDRGLRDACGELDRFMEALLTDPRYCERREQEGWLQAEQNKLNEIRRRATAFIDAPNLDPFDDFNHDFTRPGNGELARMSCSLPVLIGMQFRKKQLSLLNMHFGRADAALAESCSGRRVPGEEFLRYLREGMKAYEGK